MAGINKVDEYDGEYVGCAMYGYRHSFIQVAPKNLHLFRGQKHVMVYWKSEDVLKGTGGWESITTEPGRCLLREPPPYSAWYAREDKICKPLLKKVRDGKLTFQDVDRMRRNFAIAERRYRTEHHYTVYVPGLPGRVDGKYVMWTSARQKTERRLKSLFGGRLNIVYNIGVRNVGNCDLPVAYFDRLISDIYGTPYEEAPVIDDDNMYGMAQDAVDTEFADVGLSVATPEPALGGMWCGSSSWG